MGNRQYLPLSPFSRHKLMCGLDADRRAIKSLMCERYKSNESHKHTLTLPENHNTSLNKRYKNFPFTIVH